MRPLCSRRHFLYSSGFGLGSVGLAHLLSQEKLAAAPSKPDLGPVVYDLKPKSPHFEPKAKAMISIFLIGGPSQIDLFDPKPKLKEYDGKDFPGEIQFDNVAEASRKLMAPPWKFQRYGKSGIEMSELIPHIGSIADDITLIRSMRTGVNNHLPSMYALNSGRGVGGRPTLGSWLTYGLGSVSQELPAFVAMTDPRGLPLIGGENWTNAWLPSLYQGTVARPREPRILNLDPPEFLKGRAQENQLGYLNQINQMHLQQHPGESDLAARISNYELAAKMQLSAKEAFDISRESSKTLDMYGVNDPATKNYGTRCLVARRLVERGVRFVQIWNPGQSWDHHGYLFKSLPTSCKEVDQPSAALVKDLKARGLLDSTIVHWGGEMGRLPVIQNNSSKEKIGRDHNTFGFSQWVAGGGFKGGHVHGQTDEFAHKAIEGIVDPQDWLATVLHQFGLDQNKLVFKRNGRELSLTDGLNGKIVKEIIA
jgi:hypothetical protein